LGHFKKERILKRTKILAGIVRAASKLDSVIIDSGLLSGIEKH